MGASIELVVTDLDGTLWHGEGDMHPRVRRALDSLARDGVPLLAATGRRVGSVRRALEPFGLAPPAVVINGSLGLDLATGERFHRGGFEPDAAERVLAAFFAHGLDPCVYVDGDGVEVFVSEAPSTHPEHLTSFGDGVRTGTLVDVVAAERVLGFGVLGMDRDAGRAIVAALDGVGTSHFDVDRRYGGCALTVAPLGASKWDGVVAFCERHGFDRTRVLAVGDGPNDVEMLREAVVAVAPSDGHPAAVALADHVVDPASAGGWASVLDLI